MAVEVGDPWRLIYLPLIVLAAIIPTSLLIGTVCGLIAALLASCLVRTAFVSKPMITWCRTGGVVGLVLSAFIIPLFIRISENQNPILWFVVFGVAGFCWVLGWPKRMVPI